ncbi:hypothetical protein COB55_03505 [Candidatus Wolfebacteria bacterium]|nr:MAG: hypothetical protein COB55_03505 [Candidatus Wolfebacteria bacterium]
MTFKIGDKIRIRKGINPPNPSPKNINGTIIDNTLPRVNPDRKYAVKWDNGEINCYIDHEIEYWCGEPIRELLNKIGSISFKNTIGYGEVELREDYKTLGLIIEINISEDQKQYCRDLWEKYNKY